MVALLVTLAMALIGVSVTGLIINVEGIFDPLREHQFFNDEFFWALPTDAKSLGSKKGSMQVILLSERFGSNVMVKTRKLGWGYLD